MNPQRDAIERLGREAMVRPSPFRDEAEAALTGFREGRLRVEAKVRQGDLTAKVAREETARLAGEMAAALKARAAEYSGTNRAFLDRLVDASDRRKAGAERASLDALQRETNRLLRSVLVEQQIGARREEFERRSFVRPVGGGRPSPTLDGLLAFHQSATISGDEAAAEWARRQLESQRPLATRPEDQRRIDLATDRPDRVNPRVVSTYIESVRGMRPDEVERFVTESVAAKDANACMAAFVLAREAPEGARLRWVRMVLDGLAEFPDAALGALREAEAEARMEERSAAMAQADFAIARAEAEARLAGVQAPTEADLARRAAVASRPMARPGEAIGLTLERRGAFEGEAPDADAPGVAG